MRSIVVINKNVTSMRLKMADAQGTGSSSHDILQLFNLHVAPQLSCLVKNVLRPLRAIAGTSDMYYRRG